MLGSENYFEINKKENIRKGEINDRKISRINKGIKSIIQIKFGILERKNQIKIIIYITKVKEV